MNFLKYTLIQKKTNTWRRTQKAFINDENFKINKKNNPRIFSNTVNIKKEKNVFNKGIFTLCQFRDNDGCPPWTIQSKKCYMIV